jgi:hypothetical protein
MDNSVKLQKRIRDSVGGHIALGKFMDNSSPPIREYPKLSNPVNPTPKQFGICLSDVPNIGKWEFSSPLDPFSLTHNEFLSLALDDAKDLLQRVSDLCNDEIKEAWRNGSSQIVICDGKIVLESKDSKDIPNETVEQISKELDKACYVFSAPDKVEESAWTPVIDDADYYPTLYVYLGTENQSEAEITKGLPICADFDTGNPCYKIFDANQVEEPLNVFTPLELRRGTHLGRNYDYFSKRVKICIRDENGLIGSVTSTARFVSEWEGCAVTQVSPNRVGYIGRDVLSQLKLKIELDAKRRITRILSLDPEDN